MKTVSVKRLDIPDEGGYTQAITLETAVANMVNGLVLQGGHEVSVQPSGDVRGVIIIVSENRGKWAITEVDA